MTQSSKTCDRMFEAAKTHSRAVDRFRFSSPVTHVYNPLEYAWPAHELYLRNFGASPKRVLFLGMNPGPFGMAQTGVPFGEISAVRDWMKIEAPIAKPHCEHVKRPVEGFSCKRSEVSGRRLWGLFADRFVEAEKFFKDHFVINYCPLAFFDYEGRNITPDKLPKSETSGLLEVCDRHLGQVVEILQPRWLIGIGEFARKRADLVCADLNLEVGKILHPSPASPAANRDWSGKVTEQLIALGVW